MPVDPPEADGAALMLRAKHGDRGAFAEIVALHQQKLLNFFHASGVSSDAEDLAQETFVRLYRYRKRYERRAKLATFLHILARQVYIDHIRRIDRRKRWHEGAREQHELLTSPPRAPDGHRIDAQALLQRLPDDLRETIVLAVCQGLAYGEVAKICGIPEGTVKSRVFNTLKKMRAWMEQ